MKKTIVLFVLLTGCGTTNSGIVETGPDSFMISREAGSFGNLKAENIKEAGAYCKSHEKMLQITGTQDLSTGIAWDKKAHSEVQFMCLSEGDSRLKGGPLVPVSPAPVDKVMKGN